MSDEQTPDKGPSTADCEVLTDIHTQSNLAEVEIVSLVQELIPRYRLRAETDFACSNEDFIQTPRIDGSEFEPLTNSQIRALLDYYAVSSDRISQMTKTYHDISAVTRLLEERENDLQMAVTLGHTLLESNDTLRNQLAILENDIQQTNEIVKQLKHDLSLKERIIRFYNELEQLEETLEKENTIDAHQYQQKIRHLEDENNALRAEASRLRQESENYEQKEQAIVDNFVHALAVANAEIDQLHTEISKKTDDNSQQNKEIIRLTYEMREVRRLLNDLTKENDDLKVFLSVNGKSREEYEAKIHKLEDSYRECLAKLHQSQNEISLLQEKLVQNSPSTPVDEFSTQRQLVFLSPDDYANFVGKENSLKAELEQVLEDPEQLCLPTLGRGQKRSRERSKVDPNETDTESTINDSAFSDTESLVSATNSSSSSSSSSSMSSNASCCPHCQRCMSDVKSSSSLITERRRPTSFSSKLRLVKRFEGSSMLKRWQELAEPSLSSCLERMPGVYTRAQILREETEEESFVEDLSTTICPDPDDDEESTSSECLSPKQATPTEETNKLLRQVTKRLVGISIRSNDKENINEDKRTITPPSSPVLEPISAPTPNTTLRALRTSTFLRVSSLNPIGKAFAIRSPGQIPSLVNDFLRTHSTRT